MRVTKQDQLEWLANNFEKWPLIGKYFTMNRYAIGECVHAHVITREEWQQERDKMQKQDNSWHERGELPPVGCECEWVDESGVDGLSGVKYPAVGTVVYVCAHRKTPRGSISAIFTWKGDESELRVAASKMALDFRPIRTEREKAIDAACGVICKNGVHDFERGVIEKLYDAGMLKK